MAKEPPGRPMTLGNDRKVGEAINRFLQASARAKGLT